MKKILVTGANGQLGNELKVLHGNYPMFEFLFHDIDTLDLTNALQTEQYIDSIKPAYIINCAAYTAVDKAESEPEKAYELNANVPERLAKLAQKCNAKFIHTSTDYVFDGSKNTPYEETEAICPNSVYGRTKAEGDEKIKQFAHVIIIRTAWLYSSFGNNFMKTIMKRGKELGSLNVVFDQTGSPTYARDLAVAIMVVIEQTEQDGKFQNGIYHFSNEGVCSWYDFAIEIIKYAKISCVINPILTSAYPTPAKRPPYSVLNKTKIKTVFSVQIPHWRDSLRDCIKLIAE